MEKFEEILIKYKFPKRTEQTRTTVEEIEARINFKLPNDYKSFLLNFEGFENFIGNEYVRLWDIDELIETNVGYEIIENLPLTIGIGTDGAGEFIAIEKSQQDSVRVVLSPFIGLDKQDHIEIGESFSDFLVRLENGQEWFENADEKRN